MRVLLLICLLAHKGVFGMAAVSAAEDVKLRSAGKSMKSVALMMVPHPTNKGQFDILTSTLIGLPSSLSSSSSSSSSWLITAAHGIPGHEAIAAKNNGTVGVERINIKAPVHFGERDVGQAPDAFIDYVLISKSIKMLAGFHGRDVALCHLSKPVKNIPVIPLLGPKEWAEVKAQPFMSASLCGRGINRQAPQQRYDRHLFTGELFTKLATLKTYLGVGNMGSVFYDDLWYMATLRVNDDYLQNFNTIKVTDKWRSGPFSHKIDVSKEARPLKGDSGSGVFVDYQGKSYLAGIYSGNISAQLMATKSDGSQQSIDLVFNRIEPLIHSDSGATLTWVADLLKGAGLGHLAESRFSAPDD